MSEELFYENGYQGRIRVSPYYGLSSLIILTFVGTNVLLITAPIIHPTLDQPDHTSDRKGQENDKKLGQKGTAKLYLVCYGHFYIRDTFPYYVKQLSFI